MTTNTKRENYANNHGIVQNLEIKVNYLEVLEKEPLDNYFKGHKKKRKKKSRTQNTFKLSVFNDKEFQPNEAAFIEPRIFHQEEECKEKSTKDKKLEDKIKIHQKMKEHEERHNHIKQRLIEKNFLKQQEDLVETWYEIIKRNNKLKQLDGNLDSEPSYFEQKKTKYYPQIGISLLSKEFWNDEGNSKKATQNKVTKQSDDSSSVNESALEYVGKKFLEKLVFVDDDKD